MADPQAQALARELSRGAYDADDLPNLARNVYVRCLLKIRSVGGRSGSAKDLALTVTGEVLKELVGMHFGAGDVQGLLNEQAGVVTDAPGEPAKAAPALDPHDLGL